MGGTWQEGAEPTGLAAGGVQRWEEAPSSSGFRDSMEGRVSPEQEPMGGHGCGGVPKATWALLGSWCHRGACLLVWRARCLVRARPVLLQRVFKASHHRRQEARGGMDRRSLQGVSLTLSPWAPFTSTLVPSPSGRMALWAPPLGARSRASPPICGTHVLTLAGACRAQSCHLATSVSAQQTPPTAPRSTHSPMVGALQQRTQRSLEAGGSW